MTVTPLDTFAANLGTDQKNAEKKAIVQTNVNTINFLIVI